MPPLSPMPGWTSGDVCSERTASERTRVGTLAGGFCFPFGRGNGFRHFVCRSVTVLVAEGFVDLDEGLLLVLVDVGVWPDLSDEGDGAVASLEDAGPHVQGLG